MFQFIDYQVNCTKSAPSGSGPPDPIGALPTEYFGVPDAVGILFFDSIRRMDPHGVRCGKVHAGDLGVERDVLQSCLLARPG